jgi:exonuclease SbcC
MLLRYLKLENFLSHKDETIIFPERGMFFLTGESGSGKSSLIIDALAYSLFGPSAVTRVKKQTELLNDDNVDQDMLVKAIFEFNAQQLVIERGFNKGISFAKLYEPDANDPQSSVLLAEGVQPVSKEISRRLGGMTWQQFYAAFVARQQEISHLTSLKGAERKNLIHRMLGMRELEKSSELIAGKLRRAKAELEQVQRSIGGVNLEEQAQQVKDSQKEINRLKKLIQDKEQQKTDCQKEITQLDEKINELNPKIEDNKAIEKLENNLQTASAQLELAQQNSDRHLKASKIVEQGKNILLEKEDLEKLRDALRQKYLLSVELNKKTAQLNSLQEELGKLSESELSESNLKNQLSVNKTQQLNTNENTKERKAQLDKLKDSGECYVCQRPFSSEDDHKSIVSDMEQEITAQEKKYQDLLKQEQDILDKVPQAQKVDNLRNKINQLEARIEDLNQQELQESSVLADQGKQASKKLEEINIKAGQITTAKQDINSEAVQQAKHLTNKVQEIKQQLSKLSKTEINYPAYQKIVDKKQETKTTLEGLSQQLPLLNNQLQQAENLLVNQQKTIKGYKEEFASLDRLTNKSLIIEQTSAYFKAYQRHLAEQIKPALQEIGSEMLNQVSSSKYVELLIDDDYEISVTTADGTVRRASVLSGGEQVRANICLRLALTRLVSQRTGVPVGFLILDEPLPSQDPGHIERILELLSSLRPFYQQQFIISHVGDLRGADELDYIVEFDTLKDRNRIQISNA